MKKTLLILVMSCAAMVSGGATRIFRAPRLTRGGTNVVRLQPIDEASWIWAPGESPTPYEFVRFECEFEVRADEEKLIFDVSADERFHLTLDGEFVARGPDRGTVENWQYATYEVELKPGRHRFAATVSRLGELAPIAQLSYRGGFIFKAEGAYDARLTTGKAEWRVARLSGYEPRGLANGAWGLGSQWRITGCSAEFATPKTWQRAVVVRGPAGSPSAENIGYREPGWMLFPSQLPDQLERRCCPGRVVAVAKDTARRSTHVYTADEARETIDLSRPFTVPSNTIWQLAWNLGSYQCAYPVVTLSGGRGAAVSLKWSESAIDAKTKLKGGEEGSRDRIAGRYLDGFGDQFVSDGRPSAVFTTPWFRSGKWCRVVIETRDEPLTVESVGLLESRYPLEMESAFTTPNDTSLPSIREICARSLQMCAHEMLFDCPYYEQQMYPGDTRVQLNVLSAMGRDDRLIRRAIEFFDLAARDDGLAPFNWPTRQTQEGAAYTLAYLLMYGDYVMNHADRAWLRARLPGQRRTMSAFELYENERGLLENLPGWNFVDWTEGWSDGVPPGGVAGQGVNAEINLLWLLALDSAAKVESALGNEELAAQWRKKAEKLKKAIVEAFWSPERGLLASTVRKDDFSEHAQALAILGDVLPPEQAALAFRHLAEDADLRRCTVYFSYYLFEAYFKMGRGDLFLKRLDPWREFVKKGLTTTQESPDRMKDGARIESRSDCHAWGAHPLYFMQTGLAGIRPDAPFFERVRVAPCPGPLRKLTARHPHPKGWIEVRLDFVADGLLGVIETPVPGVFAFKGHEIPLRAGKNPIAIDKEGVHVGWRTARARELEKMGIDVFSETKFLGGDRIVFRYANGLAWIVEPPCEPCRGKWVWVMKWPGAGADRTGQRDALQRGYRYVYLDDNCWMNEEGLRNAKALYDFLTGTLGFERKVPLIGMSWGGFYSTRFAAAYPDCVRAVYLDNPLLTFGAFKLGEWKDAAKAWDCDATAAKDWARDARMPVNLAAQLAKTGIPVLIAYGTADKTVDPKECAETFIERFRAAGGKIDVVVREGMDHHPHGFVDPKDYGRVIDFFERAAVSP